MAFFWPKKEIQVLIERVNDNCDWPEVSRHLPFTPSECKGKFKELEMKVVKLLVTADVSIINHKNEEGWTALRFAASNGCLEICMILKSHGATLNMTDKVGYSPSQVAARRGNVEIYNYLLIDEA